MDSKEIEIVIKIMHTERSHILIYLLAYYNMGFQLPKLQVNALLTELMCPSLTSGRLFVHLNAEFDG